MMPSGSAEKPPSNQTASVLERLKQTLTQPALAKRTTAETLPPTWAHSGTMVTATTAIHPFPQTLPKSSMMASARIAVTTTPSHESATPTTQMLSTVPSSPAIWIS
jgi:hypothetical protein